MMSAYPLAANLIVQRGNWREGPKAVITKVIRSPRRYERPAMEWQEIVCAENPFDFFARKNGAVVPAANKPDF